MKNHLPYRSALSGQSSRHPFASRVLGLRRYLLAVLSVLLALQINWFLDPHLSISPPFMTFLAAIMLTAWHDGFPPALFATVLSTIVFDYYFMAPIQHFVGGPADMATLVLF